MESKHLFKAFATFKQYKPECLLLFSSFFTAQLPNPHSLPFLKKKKTHYVTLTKQTIQTQAERLTVILGHVLFNDIDGSTTDIYSLRGPVKMFPPHTFHHLFTASESKAPVNC